MQRILPFALSFLPVLTPATAQDPCLGNAIGGAYITTTAARIGGTLQMDLGSLLAPSGVCVLSISGGLGPVVYPHPLVGTICLDVASGAYATLLLFLDPTGNYHLSVPIAANPALVNYAPLYADALTLENSVFSISKTVRVSWENPDGWHPLAGTMTGPRLMHSATALGGSPRDQRTEVLIAGGGTGNIITPNAIATTEIFDPRTRTFRAGPSLSLPRAQHAAVRLRDDRVLITGGVTTGGVVTDTCDLYDPATDTITPGPLMNAPRAGHAITLLGDGRVLVSGGLTNWVNAATQFVTVLNSVQIMAQIYDPATNTWGPTINMLRSRAGHGQVLLPDGVHVLIIGGINGGAYAPTGVGQYQIPVFTPLCDIMDTSAGSTVATGQLPIIPGFISPMGLGFPGASLLPNGDVLVTGGFASIGSYSAAAATSNCCVWSVLTGTWSNALAPLGASAAMHTQVPYGTGAIVAGGYTGDLTLLQATDRVGFHDGTAFTVKPAIGLDPGLGGVATPRAAHALTPLFDGTFLLTGGSHTTTVADTGFVLTK